MTRFFTPLDAAFIFGAGSVYAALCRGIARMWLSLLGMPQ